MPLLLNSGSPLEINDVVYVGTVKAKVEVKDKTEAWLQTQKKNIENALGAMARAVVYRARMTVPYDPKHKGSNPHLSETGRVEETTGLTRTVKFGTVDTPYAAYQERGMRFTGTHIVHNYSTPGTGKRYLQHAAETTIKEGIKKYL